ncbi:MAG: TOPRIM nucleotidyl transferase/hydrolase domain-containing protein [Actinomycetota bacterium]
MADLTSSPTSSPSNVGRYGFENDPLAATMPDAGKDRRLERGLSIYRLLRSAITVVRMRAGMFTSIDASARTVVLVEGVSDLRVLETLAARRGHDLASAGVAIVAMGGATNVRHAIDRFGPDGLDLRLTGLVDAPEESDYRRALERAGLTIGPTRADLERIGFFVCEADLEDELIRALGPARVEGILEARGDLSTFRTFQRQPAQRGRPIEAQLRRFKGTRSGRKEAYAAYLVEALDLADMPRPLDLVLRRATRAGRPD